MLTHLVLVWEGQQCCSVRKIPHTYFTVSTSCGKHISEGETIGIHWNEESWGGGGRVGEEGGERVGEEGRGGERVGERVGEEGRGTESRGESRGGGESGEEGGEEGRGESRGESGGGESGGGGRVGEERERGRGRREGEGREWGRVPLQGHWPFTDLIALFHEIQSTASK